MTKLLSKYLRPFAGMAVMAFALLLVQAVCELNLPNYMSRIVNVGIQQSGIEHAAPTRLSAEGLALVRLLANDTEQALLDGAYAQTDGGDYEKTAEDSDTLDAVFGTAAWTLVNMAKIMPGADGAWSPDSAELDLSALYPLLLPALQTLPRESVLGVRATADGIEPTLLKQSGAVLTAALYRDAGVDLEAMQRQYILRVGGQMTLIALLGGAAAVLVGYFASKAAAGTSRGLRRALFGKIESFNSAEFDRFSTASLITRCTNDVGQIHMLIAMGLRMFSYAPIMGVGGIIMAVGKSPSMSWIIAVAVLVLLCMLVVLLTVALPRFKRIQQLTDRLNLVSRETLNGVMVIRAFGTQAHESERFQEASQAVSDNFRFVNRVAISAMMPLMSLVMNGAALLIVWVGAHQIEASALQVGDMIAFIQYSMQIIMSFLMISMVSVFLPQAAVSAERINEVFDTPASVLDPDDPVPYDPAKAGVVEFDHVSFRYGGADRDALHDVSFTAAPGTTTAIIGSTGSGKSTVANLLVRFYDVTEGAIRVGGADVRTVTQHDLRAKIGYVPQKGVLLSGTIASNLRYGDPDADDEEIALAAEIAQATGFIAEKEDGYESEVAQGGGNVSGGQRQRLSIARALVKKPEILVFDDSFSALDFKTDAAVRAALARQTARATVIVVAQRVNTIMHADQILVLEHGEIVGRGTHSELLRTCPEYLEIASSQLAKEELV